MRTCSNRLHVVDSWICRPHSYFTPGESLLTLAMQLLHYRMHWIWNARHYRQKSRIKKVNSSDIISSLVAAADDCVDDDENKNVDNTQQTELTSYGSSAQMGTDDGVKTLQTVAKGYSE